MKYCSCGSEAMKSCAPKVLAQFTIPFTQIEIHIWNWNNDSYEDLCSECFLDESQSRENERARQAYNAGYENGYEKAVKDN